jgi:DNA-binding MarR family transcriptional regulator
VGRPRLPSTHHRPGREATVRKLAWLRYRLRRFLRFSERAARSGGLTPQQHQLLLGIVGYTGRGWATISELAEFLQERHNAVVGLVQRAARRGLVRKEKGARDRRYVRVRVTRQGRAILVKLTRMHMDALRHLDVQISDNMKDRPPSIKAARGA